MLFLPTFLFVEKVFTFQPSIFSFHFFKSKTERFDSAYGLFFRIFPTYVFFPQFFSHFSLFHIASFPDFPQLTHPRKFYTKSKKFSSAFFKEKSTSFTRQKHSTDLSFSNFSNISTVTKTNTSKI